MKDIVIDIVKECKNTWCTSVEDGQLINDEIVRAFNKGYKVKLSFKNVEFVITGFLNVAVGQLYSKYTEEFIKSNLSVESIQPCDIILLKRTVINAKKFYADSERFKRSLDALLSE